MDASPLWHRRGRFLLLFTLGHAVLSVVVFLFAFAHGMASAHASTAELALSWFSAFLLSPLFIVVVRSDSLGPLFPGVLGFLPVFANSFLWALAAWWAVAFRRRRLARRPSVA